MKLQAGEAAPDFRGKDQDGKIHTLKDYRGKKLILYFYPEDDTLLCTLEACNLRDNYSLLLKKGFAILGVSADDEDSHRKFISKFKLPFPLLADTSRKIMLDYDSYGEKNMYGIKRMGIKRHTFVIDESGKILKIFQKPKSRQHAEQILAALGM